MIEWTQWSVNFLVWCTTKNCDSIGKWSALLLIQSITWLLMKRSSFCMCLTKIKGWLQLLFHMFCDVWIAFRDITWLIWSWKYLPNVQSTCIGSRLLWNFAYIHRKCDHIAAKGEYVKWCILTYIGSLKYHQVVRYTAPPYYTVFIADLDVSYFSYL